MQANAACLSTSGKLLTEKIDVMRLTFYIAPITASFILPLLLHVEVRWIEVKTTVVTMTDLPPLPCAPPMPFSPPATCVISHQ